LDVSVVVCAKNAERTIEECLESVRMNNPFEIIVIDDGSTDKTAEISRKFTSHIYSNDGGGLPRARQLGAEMASGSYIFYVDSDVILTKDCLQTMMREMKANGYSGIHAQVLGAEDGGYWGWAEDQRFRMRFNRVGEAPYIATMAAIFERDVILKYQFDPFFTMSVEDGDLCYRLRKAHFKFGISSAFVYHRHRATAAAFIKQRVRYGKGSARFFWKHRSLVSLLGASAQLPFGIFVCIKQRSVRMLPYYLVWSTVGTYGTLTEIATLTFRKLVPDIPK